MSYQANFSILVKKITCILICLRFNSSFWSKTCAEVKPVFFRQESGVLIKSTQPLERISINFKGPLPSSSVNKYLLIVVNEYFRFPFAFPCKDILLGQ